MDSIKGQVAHKVFSMVKDTDWNSVVPPPDEDGSNLPSRPNDATYVTDLETMIRIRTRFGPRYFVVKVKEQY